jgi:hypothetical protein
MTVKVTPRVKAEAFLIDAAGGETLEYEVSALGNANFVLLDAGSVPTNRLISSVKDAPSSPGTWKRTWPRAADPISIQSEHNLSMSFANATKYTYIAKQRSASGATKTILDIDYESTDPTDTFIKSVVVILH